MSRPLLIALLPSVIAIAWLVSKAQWFWTHRPDLQFGWIVLMLSAFIAWEAWPQRPEARYRWSIWSVAAGTVGGALLFLVQIYQAAFGMKAASLCGLALGVILVALANLHYVFGWAGVRQFGFAVLFLIIALPMPSAIHNLIVGGLQAKVAYFNVELLNLIGIPARRVGSVIQLPSCTVGVDEACSGIRSLQSTVMATLFIGHLTLKRLGLRTLLFVAGIGLALVGNLGRSFFLSYTANAKGIEALKASHDAAGWSILLFTAGGVALLGWLLGKVEKQQLPAQEGTGRPKG